MHNALVYFHVSRVLNRSMPMPAHFRKRPGIRALVSHHKVGFGEIARPYTNIDSASEQAGMAWNP
jgi:hypothetical protein